MPDFLIGFDWDKARAHPLQWNHEKGRYDPHGYDLRPAVPLESVIWHSSEPRRCDSSIGSQLDFIRDSRDVSAHYYVLPEARGGVQIERILDPTPWMAYHAGISLWKGRRGFNTFSVGIELVHRAGCGPYPARQIAALLWLTRQLLTDHPTIRRGLIGLHRWIAVDDHDHYGRKEDPTDKTDAEWQALIDSL